MFACSLNADGVHSTVHQFMDSDTLIQLEDWRELWCNGAKRQRWMTLPHIEGP